MYVAPEGELGDMMKRDFLLTRVHHILKEQIQEIISHRPTTSYQEVYDHLKKYFKVDNPHLFKAKWLEVKLRTRGEEVELTELMLFRSKFVTALARVEDYTDHEVIEVLLKNFPSTWVEKILHEEAKRAKRPIW